MLTANVNDSDVTTDFSSSYKAILFFHKAYSAPIPGQRVFKFKAL